MAPLGQSGNYSDSLKRENETLREDYEKLLQDLNILKSENERLGKEAFSKVEFYGVLAAAVVILLVVILCFAYYIARLKRDIKRQRRDDEEVQQERKSLKRENETPGQDSFKIENETLREDCGELQQERKTLKQEKEKVEAGKEALQKKYETLKKEKGKVEADLKELQRKTKKEDLQKQNETLKQEKEKVEAEKEDLQKQNDSLKRENETLREEKEGLQKQKDIYKEEVEADFDELRRKTNTCGYALDREWKPITEACVNVTLDRDTASPSLTVSEDGSQVRFTGEGSAEWPSVLGREGFTSGRHYWEVEVGEKGYWVLGVSTHPPEKSIPEKPGEGYWLVRLFRGKTCTAVSQSGEKILKLEKICKVWGVYLDREGGRLSFYNAETRFHIHTLEGSFPGQVYPIFSPGSHDKGPLIIKAKVKNV